MCNKKNIDSALIEEADKYDGTKQSIARLCFLFKVAFANIRDFVDEGKKFRSNVSKSLNEKIEKENLSNYELNQYINSSKFKESIYYDVFLLNVRLFNTLSSFYALRQFSVYDDKDSKKRYAKQKKELSKFNEIINNKLQAKFIYKRKSISINNFLKKCRDFLIHKGKMICKFEFLPNYDNTKGVPALSIRFSEIWKDFYLQKNMIEEDSGVDAIEVFSVLDSIHDDLQSELDKLIET